MQVIKEYTQGPVKPWNNGPQTGYWMTIKVGGQDLNAASWPSPAASIFRKTSTERGVEPGGKAVLFRDGDKLFIAAANQHGWPNPHGCMEIAVSEKTARLLGVSLAEICG